MVSRACIGTALRLQPSEILIRIESPLRVHRKLLFQNSIICLKCETIIKINKKNFIYRILFVIIVNNPAALH